MKHSYSFRGHKTSIYLEDEFYSELKRIAAKMKTPVSYIISGIDEKRTGGSLSMATRLFILEYKKSSRPRAEGRR